MPTNQIGRETLTVSTASVPLVSFGVAKHAIIYVATSPIRWRADGTDPTSTTGMFVQADSYIEFMELHDSYSGILRKIEFIRDTTASADAVLEIAYFD